MSEADRISKIFACHKKSENSHKINNRWIQRNSVIYICQKKIKVVCSMALWRFASSMTIIAFGSCYLERFPWQSPLRCFSVKTMTMQSVPLRQAPFCQPFMHEASTLCTHWAYPAIRVSSLDAHLVSARGGLQRGLGVLWNFGHALLRSGVGQLLFGWSLLWWRGILPWYWFFRCDLPLLLFCSMKQWGAI